MVPPIISYSLLLDCVFLDTIPTAPQTYHPEMKENTVQQISQRILKIV